MIDFRDFVKAELRTVDFPKTQWCPEEFEKKQIVLHHTASGKGVDGDFRSWKSNPERIATSVIIDADGVIHQCFPSRNWAYHIGIAVAGNEKVDVKYRNNGRKYDQHSIGVEVDCWGGLKQRDGKWYAYPNKFGTTGKGVVIPEENVIVYNDGFRGFTAFERYTDAQVETTRQLLVYWSKCYNIPLTYNEDIWGVCKRALDFEKGVFTHNCYRADKSDIHPQPEYIEMLKQLDFDYRNNKI